MADSNTQILILFLSLFLLKKRKRLVCAVVLIWIFSFPVSAQIEQTGEPKHATFYGIHIDSTHYFIKEILKKRKAPQNAEEWGNLYQQIAEKAEQTGETQLSLKYYKLARQTHDSLKVVQIRELKEQLRLSGTREQSPQQKAINKNELILQKRLRNVFIYFSVVILFIAFFLYRINWQRAKANKLLLEQNLAMSQQKEKVIQSQIALEKTNRLLELQNYEITLKNDEIQAQNQDVKDSIEYAQRIQAALLPSAEKLGEIIKDSFVLLKPKDIVSGDFYWVHQEGTKVILAAIDCTGHGVPGAFMSLIAKQLLDDIIIQQKITQPEKILNQLHEKVRTSLNQAESDNKDGMDMTLCTIDKEQKKLIFAGAYNPMVLIQNEEIEIIKGDSFPIGGWHFQGTDRAFKQTEVELMPGKDAMIYLSSDGYQDQFGGKEDRKFMKSRFRKLLKSIHQKPLTEQKEILNQTIEEWKGDYPQVDDILVIGVKLNANGDFI